MYRFKTFWKQLLEISEKKGFTLFSGVTPSKSSSLAKQISKDLVGVSGLYYEYSLLVFEARVQLRISNKEKKNNKKILNELKQLNLFSDVPMEYLLNPDCNYSRLSYRVNSKGIKDEAYWRETQTKMVEAMQMFERKLKPHYPHLKSLNLK